MRQKSKRMGRPPVPKSEKRQWRVTLNFSEDEHRALEEAARDRAPSDYAREVVLRHLARRR